jgi:hypothetical protein
MRAKLYVSQIPDPYIQQNFKTIGELFRGNPFLKGAWRFLEFEVKVSGSQKITHGLNFVPKDVLVTSVLGGTIVFEYSDFDRSFLSFTATVSSAPMTVRAFVGTYSEETINV